VTVAERIVAALSVLRGLPLWTVRRAADLQNFQFGERRTVASPLPSRRGQVYDVGAFALHVQCAWRLRGPEGIVVASRDRFYPAGNPDEVADDFDWDRPGANRCDARTADFVATICPLPVEAISADDVGGFTLSFSHAHALEVFPHDSLGREQWRLLSPSTEAPHVVFEGGRLEHHGAV